MIPQRLLSSITFLSVLSRPFKLVIVLVGVDFVLAFPSISTFAVSMLKVLI